MNLKNRVGLTMLIVSWVLVMFLFFHAFFNPNHTVILNINNHGEMYIEFGVLIISCIFIPLFIKDLYDKNIITLFGKKKKKDEDDSDSFSKTY